MKNTLGANNWGVGKRLRFFRRNNTRDDLCDIASGDGGGSALTRCGVIISDPRPVVINLSRKVNQITVGECLRFAWACITYTVYRA